MGGYTFERNAKGVREMFEMKYDTMNFTGDWFEAFASPERKGVWFIWGPSGNGKTTFALQLCKYLCQWGKVAYNSLEEGSANTMKNAMIRVGMMEVNKQFLLINREPIAVLTKRLKRAKAPKVIVIDSFQYTQMTYKQYLEFKDMHKDKLIIFISHADGKMPAGRSAKSVMYDASLKIFVEGYRAISKGRYIGPRGYIDVWSEGAKKFYGKKKKNEKDNEQTDNPAAD